MTNIERAAEVLWLPEPHLFTSECDDQARELAQALAGAGLLAPDLPEQSESTGRYAEWRALDDAQETVIWTVPSGPVMVQNVEPGNLTTQQARKVAYALLAAANYAEENA